MPRRQGVQGIPSYSAYKTYLGDPTSRNSKFLPGPGRDEGGNHCANFIEAVRTRKREILNAEIEEGHLSSALGHLANAAYRLGRTLTFDPATERCVGDDEANALLTRNYREPFVVRADV